MTAMPTTPPPEGCIDTQVLDHVLLIGIADHAAVKIKD